ncbi:MAG TPA: 16S rRNA (cytidine(1402)-2'-O)-methyltransferase [Woeseiaceae bacterium]|nr:16S rRNA (cytidine(1402)-2'-O)-methyltransferase [Woeseiaceae bacterium]
MVATPIGNLKDLTPRARQVLAEVHLIAAEDTRHTSRLLFSIGAKTRLTALHDHNEADAVPAIIEALANGQDVALVSDAGTPLVSDPGYRLVAAAQDLGIRVSPIPGPSALIAALSVAGLATDRFCFEGFLPAKAAARRKTLALLADEPRTLVFYESVHRIADSVGDMAVAFGPERPAFIGRELSKLHEQCVRSTLGELLRDLGSGEIASKGEFVVVVAGRAAADSPASDHSVLIRELAGALPLKQAAAIAARVTGEKRNEIYARMLELRK